MMGRRYGRILRERPNTHRRARWSRQALCQRVPTMNTEVLITKTLKLMSDFSIPVRDTFTTECNLDDYYSNGNTYNGPRLFRVEWEDTDEFPTARANKKYEIRDLRSVAYDDYRIVMPKRYMTSGRDDPAVHECTHFLQHNTVGEDNCYIQFSGSNYMEYISQRVEIEAHLIQVAYIFQECVSYRDSVLDKPTCDQVQSQLIQCRSVFDRALALRIILACKNGGLI